jgi:hypothetical protein
MSDLWRDLHIGDKVRIIDWPQEMHKERLHEDTRELYEWLIETKRVLTIITIDEWGLPYGEIVRSVDSIEYHESLALNHGGLEIVAQKRGC